MGASYGKLNIIRLIVHVLKKDVQDPGPPCDVSK